VLVVDAAGLEAALKDANETVAKCSRGDVIRVSGGATGLIERPCSW
jgi:hypothetical protein